MNILIFQSLVSSTCVSFYWLPKPFQRYKINFSFQISHLHFAYSAAFLQDLGIIREYFILFYIIARVRVSRKQDCCIYLILSYHFLISQHQIQYSVLFLLILELGTIFLLCYLALISLIPTIFFPPGEIPSVASVFLIGVDTSLKFISPIVLFRVCNKLKNLQFWNDVSSCNSDTVETWSLRTRCPLMDSSQKRKFPEHCFGEIWEHMVFGVRKICVSSVVSASGVVMPKLYISVWNTDSLYELKRMSSFSHFESCCWITCTCNNIFEI